MCISVVTFQSYGRSKHRSGFSDVFRSPQLTEIEGRSYVEPTAAYRDRTLCLRLKNSRTSSRILRRANKMVNKTAIVEGEGSQKDMYCIVVFRGLYT